MSRFGLRSHIEYEDDENDTTETTTTPTSVKTTKNKHKRVYQKKKKKLLSSSSSSSSSTITTSSSSPQEQHKNDSSNRLEVTTTTTKTSSTSTISLMCSLPLTRLSGFIEKLQLNKQAKKQATKYLLQQQQTDETNNILFDSLKTTTSATNKSEKADEQHLLNAKEIEKQDTLENEEEDLNHHQQQPQQESEVEHLQQQHSSNNKLNKQKQQQQQQQNTQNLIIDKLMCLYCDKLFTTAKMQTKHIEKFHMLQQPQQQQQQQQRTDRRSSVRNSTNNQQQQQQKHINCMYCKRSGATTTTTSNLIVDDLLNEINLNALFMHLIECHADKYFACKKCMLRFSNKQKLQKHMKVLHATNNTTPSSTSTTTILPYQTSSSLSSSSSLQQQSCDVVNDDITTTTIATTTKRSLRLLQQQTSLDNSNSTDTCSSAPLMSTEEPTILSRLGLAQNRLPTKRKSGMRLRREAVTTTGATTNNVLPEKLRSGRGSTIPITTTTNVSGGRNSSQSTTSSVTTESPTREVLFRMPARNESINSFVIDDDFYKEVINNVRHNLLYFLDGKLNDTTTTTTTTTTITSSINTETQQTLLVRSTLVRSPLVEDIHSKDDKELHAASLLNAITAFPTLLTAEQYGGDAAKLRRAHTKHSWKWKWDSAKKFKLINEGGKMVKKMKPLMGLRDLSKLDMWTQLSMRQKFEQQQQTVSPNELRIEKLRLNAQLNTILDKRLLPQISLEQNEQTIIKLEKAELEQSGSVALPKQQIDASAAYSTHNFLSVLQLRAKQHVPAAAQPRLILSGEWARPRSYMCMLCGGKFDKLKSLEEHKMFRHSHIYCTHYEVVGRELLANNLLQHLFLPKQALARYNAKLQGSCDTSLVTLVEDESSDSLQSSITMTTITTPAPAAQIVSPTYSLQSCSSSRQGLSPVTTPTTPTVLRTPCKIFHHNNNNNNNNTTNSDVSNIRVCSKCQRKCSGAMDLYRHMLDCSGDYIWSMVKKRKYRYYCGSKKRRRGELRKTPKQPQQQQQPPKTPDISMQKSPNNNQPTPRQRPSDAESIKKMLENLPAKRVCKQIFPVDNKKRSKKAITKQQLQQQQQRLQRRCKILAKRNHHHPHHRLHCYKTQPQQTRALRARLTKTERCKQQQKVNAKRMQKNQRNLRLKNLQTRKKQQLKDVVIKKSDNEEERPNRSITPKQQQQQTPQNDMEQNAIKIITTATTTTNTTTTTTSKSTKTTVTLPTTTVNITNTTTTTTATTTMHEIFEYANSNASSTSTCTTITLNSAASIPAASTTGVGGNTNTTRKRSKRISDCIAMLTGKLEEKLKTEKQPIKTTITTTTAPVKDKEPQQQQQQASLDEQQATLPKTPKRKAQTRRILKPPSLENIVDLIEPTTTTITATTTTTTNIVTTTVVASNSTSLAVTMKPCPKNTHVISTSVMPTIIQLPPPIPKPSAATTHTVAATATPLISVESRTTTTTTPNKLQPSLHFAQPMPMPMPLPISIQMLPMLPNNPNHTFEEPLNLTNASKKLSVPTALSQGCTPLATCSYNSNMYGLDMTTQQMYAQQDVGPLDLSLKSNRQENTKEMTASSIANIMPLALTVIPAVSHSNQPLALTVNNKQVSAKHVSAANSVSAAMFINECNKHFYSNLDLLKIPQVRSQLAALAATSTIMTPATLPTHVYTHNVDNIMNTAAGHMLPGATKATMVVAPIVKKRGNNRQQMTTTTIAATTTTATTNNNLQTTRIIRLYPNKKEHQLTMNEEVINHIDDAINSVINAVKASLTPERADDELEKTLTNSLSAVIPTTTIATILPTITTTTTIPALSTNNALNSLTTTTTTVTPTINKPLTPLAPIMPIKRRGRSKILETTTTTILPGMAVENIVTPLPPPVTTTTGASTTTTTPTTGRKSKARSNLCLIEDIRIAPEITTIPTNNMIAPLITPTTATTIIDEKLNETQQTIEENKIDETVVVQTTTTTTVTSSHETKTMEPEKLVENQKSEDELKTPKTTTSPITITTTLTTTTTIDKELENLSEKSNPTTQKKFRRRRKNELAAIVADQLLESFKIDKARRDSLKKLENLAYEQKSDDLFMTGMLLMSSTKRSVTMNNTQKQQQQQQQQQTNDLEAATTKRASLRNRQNNNNNNSSLTTTTTTTTTAKRGRRAGTGGGAGTSRRRQYVRRGKTLDNENISKLKSSLESFSIGIEKQLTEFEAKKELQQQKTNEAGTNNNNNNNNTITTKPPTCSILRPSILSATPSALTAENVAKVSEQSRSAFTSRDPRLNKNIHKETDEETLKKQATDVPNDYEEEDNYLTEIAKNVNDKIMDAENEDFMFANDGLLELEDTSSQFYSRPATSMSVRSAPNFDDRSDFGSLCGDDDDEEHTNTEVMDMDLDDEMSVYTSYSQDLGRGSGRRRRRRRRSILLTRRPKKRLQRNELETEKFECTLCKKIFFSATSLSKHNMTLAHVSKVSEQEYLLSKAALLEQGVENVLSEFPSLPKPNISRRAKTPTPSSRRAKTPTPAVNRGRKTQAKTLEDVCLNKSLTTTTTTIAAPAAQSQPQIPNKEQNSSHAGLNSDERLFFECCTILKGTQEDQENVAQKQEDSNHFSPYEYHLNNKIMAESQKNDINANKTNAHKKLNKSQSTFRDPPEYNKNEK